MVREPAVTSPPKKNLKRSAPFALAAMDKDEFRKEAGAARDRAVKAKNKLAQEKKQLAQKQHETSDMVK